MSNSPIELAEAKKRIRLAFPDVEFGETDYGRTVSVRRPGMNKAFRVSYAARPTRGETQVDAIEPTGELVASIIEELGKAGPITERIYRP